MKRLGMKYGRRKMSKKGELSEWFGEPETTTPGILNVVSQNLDQNLPQEQTPAPEQEQKEQDVKEARSMLKSIFIAGLIKTNLEELLKVSNDDLTKEYKNDILEKIEKLKEEVGKL